MIALVRWLLLPLDQIANAVYDVRSYIVTTTVHCSQLLSSKIFDFIFLFTHKHIKNTVTASAVSGVSILF